MAVWQRYPVTGFRQREMMVKVIAVAIHSRGCADYCCLGKARLRTAAVSLCVCRSSDVGTLWYGRAKSFCVFVSMPSSS